MTEKEKKDSLGEILKIATIGIFIFVILQQLGPMLGLRLPYGYKKEEEEKERYAFDITTSVQ